MLRETSKCKGEGAKASSKTHRCDFMVWCLYLCIWKGRGTVPSNGSVDSQSISAQDFLNLACGRVNILQGTGRLRVT